MVQQLYPQAMQPDKLHPDSDGKPLADNTIQFHLIMKIQGGLDTLFSDDPLVFVAGDLLWYHSKSSSKSQAPDVMVVFGRPKGDRRSYRQWHEDNIPPQVAFEILSPSNTAEEMSEKFQFYQQHGVEEYYLYDPYKNKLQGWLRQGTQLIPIANMAGWISPRLGIRFETSRGVLDLYDPAGKRFESYVETAKRADQEAQRAEQEAQRAEQQAQRAKQERQARQNAIVRLLELGLTVEQVATALDFSEEEIRKNL